MVLLAVLPLALYCMEGPVIPVRLNVVAPLRITPLFMAQEPNASVVQLTALPPKVKPPLTVAPETTAPDAFLTVTLTMACQPFRDDTALPSSPARDTETTGSGISLALEDKRL